MKCPLCRSKVTTAHIRCSSCGHALDTEAISSQERAKKKVIFKASVTMLTIVFLSVGGVLVSNKVQQNKAEEERVALAKIAAQELKEEEERERKARNDYSWVPKGYYKFAQDYDMAWKTIGYDAANCYQTCWGVKIKSNKYCSTLTITANIERNGTILDRASDSAYDVSPSNSVIMAFQSSFDTPWNAVVTRISCT